MNKSNSVKLVFAILFFAGLVLALRRGRRDLACAGAFVLFSITAASLIAMTPAGEVLALYSAPSFDPNEFVGGINAKRWSALLTDEALHRRTTTAALERARTLFCTARVVPMYEAYYRQVIGSPPARR